jgi:hypothetical protein
MKYYLLIKSHDEMPDYEDECEAKTKEDASQTFADRINSRLRAENSDFDFWSADEIFDQIRGEDEES